MSTNIQFVRIPASLVRVAELELEAILDNPTQSGLEWVGDTFEGAYQFFEDLGRLDLVESPWARALGAGEGRSAPGLPDTVALEELLAAGWVLLSREEHEEILARIEQALTADPEWAAAAHRNGPTWASVLEAGTAPPGHITAVAI